MPESLCVQCGNPLQPNARFCGSCGARLDAPPKPKPDLGRTVVDARPFGEGAPADDGAPLVPLVPRHPTLERALERTTDQPDAEHHARALDTRAEREEPAARPWSAGWDQRAGTSPLSRSVAVDLDAPPGPAASSLARTTPAITGSAPASGAPTPTAFPAGEPAVAPPSTVPQIPAAGPAAEAGAPSAAPTAPVPAAPPAQAPAAAAPAPAATVPAPTAPAPTAPAPANLPAKTMLGVAMPGIAPVRASAPPAAGAAAPPPAGPGPGPHAAGPSGPPGPAAMRSAKATMMGVMPAPSAAPPALSFAPAPVLVGPPPAAPEEEPLPARPSILTRPRRGVPLALAAGGGAVLLALGGVSLALLFRGGAPVRARPGYDATGREILGITCASCPDGTVLRLGAATATVAAQAAQLPPPAPLAVGDNDFEVAVDRPGGGRDETVRLHVPVAYRIRIDPAGLEAVPPKVLVRVEAQPTAEVTLDGKPIALDAKGAGAYGVELEGIAEGATEEVKTVDRSIPFTIRSKDGTKDEGKLPVLLPVAPLRVDAPASGAFTTGDGAVVAGGTRVGGSVTVDGQPASLDTSGSFSVRLPLPQAGKRTALLVARQPKMVPRTARVDIERVVDAEATARGLEALGPVGFDDAVARADKPDVLVAVVGEVAEIRTAGGVTFVFVQSRLGCGAPGRCLARLALGGEAPVPRGSTLRAWGTLRGLVPRTEGQPPVLDVATRLALPAAKR